MLYIYFLTATQFGQGVYFAVNSAYSVQAKYSPPDPASGDRKVYQCKVLIGHSMEGTPNMRILPQRTGSDMFYDSATNSTTNPIMYVIFNDTQAYPEYMVTFRSQWEFHTCCRKCISADGIPSDCLLLYGCSWSAVFLKMLCFILVFFFLALPSTLTFVSAVEYCSA